MKKMILVCVLLLVCGIALGDNKDNKKQVHGIDKLIEAGKKAILVKYFYNPNCDWVEEGVDCSKDICIVKFVRVIQHNNTGLRRAYFMCGKHFQDFVKVKGLTYKEKHTKKNSIKIYELEQLLYLRWSNCGAEVITGDEFWVDKKNIPCFSWESDDFYGMNGLVEGIE